MFKPLFVLALAFSAPLAAQPITPPDLLRHVERLASDEFQGRAPGTEGERLTINYIAAEFASRGLEPAGENGTWFQPVRLVERSGGETRARWTANGAEVPFEAGNIFMMGPEPSVTIADAPVVFVGHGSRIPARGVDQLAGAQVRGAVVLMLAVAPNEPGFPTLVERTRGAFEAGAVAVVQIIGSEIPWERASRALGRGRTQLDSAPVLPGPVGAMPAAALRSLTGGAVILDAPPGPDFRATLMPVRVSMEVTTRIQRYTSNNVIGRLRGSGNSGESLVFLGHWDHFGICRPEGAPDRICNGAVDNASGIASLIEIAGRLATGERPVRDILFLATTAEEEGLLGAEYFVAHPVVPLPTIVVAINMDTVAIHPAGTPVAVMGRGLPPLDRVIDETVTAMGRRLDPDDEAQALVRRQDGWRFTQARVPAIMVGGSFSDMALVEAFLNGPAYHQPADQLGGAFPLDGAAEDANLLVALARRLADPAVYSLPERTEP